jgi:hypothetical protein
VIWSTDTGASDRAAAGRRTRTSAATSCRRCSPTQKGELGDARVPLEGRSHHRHRLRRMMAAREGGAHGVLAPHLKPEHVGIGSINSPMQCMMKESARSACRSTSIR